MRSPNRSTFVPLIGILMMTLLPGCKGSSDNMVVPAAACLEFSAIVGPSAGSVTLEEASNSTCDVLSLTVMITDVADIFASSFVVEFDPAIATYTALSISSSFLGSDGATVEVLADEQPGSVSIGLTRLGSNSGIDVVGTRELVTLVFSKVATNGSGSVTFTNGVLLGSETPPQSKTGVSWSGGMMLVM